MKDSDISTQHDVDRLLRCLHKGLSPAKSHVKSSRFSGSPKTPKSKTSDTKCVDGSIAFSVGESLQNFVTPDTKRLNLEPFTKELSPGVFYGSPIGKHSKRPPQVLRLLHEIRRDLAAEGYLISRHSIWATFAKQDQAIQFVESHGNKDIAVFSYQDHISGQRRFLATTYKEFWRRYEAIPENQRHHYEIITEGSPCHLYFDLEYNRKANMDLNGDTLVDLLLLKVAEALQEIYQLKYDSSWTIELDSTTEEKFSRHIIIRIPNVAFKDNSHVGAFVTELCHRIDMLRNEEERLNDLFVLKGQNRGDCSSSIFVDQAVYTRNRCFRLPFSSKAGKTSRLVPTGRFRCNRMTERQIFEDSLICKVEPECNKLLTFGKVSGQGGSLSCFSADSFNLRLPKAAEFCMSGRTPFPAVDMFIESIACIEGIPGKIRSWYWFSEYGVLVYNIVGNRYCENIGRQHKSNNVMYIVDFRTAGYYQKCHDPDCKGYRSPLRPIPRHTIPSNFPFSTQGYDNRGEDNGWWEEVCKSFENILLEKPSNQAVNYKDHFTGPSPMDDDNKEDDNAWWEEVCQSFEKVQEKPNLPSVNKDALDEPILVDDEWWEVVTQELDSQGI